MKHDRKAQANYGRTNCDNCVTVISQCPVADSQTKRTLLLLLLLFFFFTLFVYLCARPVRPVAAAIGAWGRLLVRGIKLHYSEHNFNVRRSQRATKQQARNSHEICRRIEMTTEYATVQPRQLLK